MDKKPVVNIADVEPMTFGNGGRFEGHFRWVSQQNASEKLGYNFVTLSPGKTSFPYHFHRGIEEAFFIMEGTGVVRFDDEEYPLKPGDVVACPAGKGGAHQISNNSDADLKYLAVSTKPDTDIVHYPDSGKIAVASGPDATDPEAAPFRMVILDDAGVDYWDGEDERDGSVAWRHAANRRGGGVGVDRRVRGRRGRRTGCRRRELGSRGVDELRRSPRAVRRLA